MGDALLRFFDGRCPPLIYSALSGLFTFYLAYLSMGDALLRFFDGRCPPLIYFALSGLFTFYLAYLSMGFADTLFSMGDAHR
jgi:hypothetical protein